MADSTNVSEIIRISFNSHKPSISFESNWWVILLIFIILIICYIIRNRFRKFFRNLFISESTIEIKIGVLNINQKIRRNYQNLYIANRIYIELVTRKAAIPIDEENDVIKEVYDSWYVLFKTIREEIKNLPGEYLVNDSASKKLIDLTIQILNDGLRPHLTLYQAKFRKWYDKKLVDSDIETSPQEIQKEFKKHKELMDSMREVNKILKLYSEQLKNFIDNKKQ